MSRFSHKLSALGYHRLRDSSNVVQWQPALELMNRGINIPKDYEEFLNEFPETGIFDRQVVFLGQDKSPWASNGEEILEVLYGCCHNPDDDIFSVRSRYIEEIGESYLAFGEVTGANLLCMACAGENVGKIYVWDHEYVGQVADSFYLAFDNFSEFIDGLAERAEVRDTTTKLTGMALSGALRERAFEMLKKNN